MGREAWFTDPGAQGEASHRATVGIPWGSVLINGLGKNQVLAFGSFGVTASYDAPQSGCRPFCLGSESAEVLIFA